MHDSLAEKLADLSLALQGLAGDSSLLSAVQRLSSENTKLLALLERRDSGLGTIKLQSLLEQGKAELKRVGEQLLEEHQDGQFSSKLRRQLAQERVASRRQVACLRAQLQAQCLTLRSKLQEKDRQCKTLMAEKTNFELSRVPQVCKVLAEVGSLIQEISKLSFTDKKGGHLFDETGFTERVSGREENACQLRTQCEQLKREVDKLSQENGLLKKKLRKKCVEPSKDQKSAEQLLQQETREKVEMKQEFQMILGELTMELNRKNEELEDTYERIGELEEENTRLKFAADHEKNLNAQLADELREKEKLLKEVSLNSQALEEELRGCSRIQAQRLSRLSEGEDLAPTEAESRSKEQLLECTIAELKQRLREVECRNADELKQFKEQISRLEGSESLDEEGIFVRLETGIDLRSSLRMIREQTVLILEVCKRKIQELKVQRAKVAKLKEQKAILKARLHRQ